MGKKLIIKGADFSINGIAPEFQKLKCIVTTSRTQTMRSPVNFPATGRVVIDFAVTNVSGSYNLFGYTSNTAYNPERQYYFGTIYNVSSYFSGGFGILGYINKKQAQATTDIIKDQAKHTLDASRYALKVDGQSVTIVQQTTTDVAVPFGILGVSDYLDRDAVGSGVKLYSVKMYSNYQDNNSLILDAIPVKILADNKVCLYDRISGEYIYTKDETNPNYEELD